VSTIVAYLRVSRERQGKSGLGLEAQREAIKRFADGNGFSIEGEYVEVETGKSTTDLPREVVPTAMLA